LAWHAIIHAWDEGAALAGSSAGAMALCDPMVDPRGGAFTLGLGLVNQLAVLPHADTWSPDKARRTFELAPQSVTVVAIDEQTALIREAHGKWRAAGVGTVKAYRGGHPVELSELPG
jgi:cyanophycinase